MYIEVEWCGIELSDANVSTCPVTNHYFSSLNTPLLLTFLCNGCTIMYQNVDMSCTAHGSFKHHIKPSTVTFARVTN